MVPSELLALCEVVRSGSGDLHALAFGDTRGAWRAAADVSAEAHVRYLDRPVRRMLAVRAHAWMLARYGVLPTRRSDGPASPPETLHRYGDEQLYALPPYVYSLRPPANPNRVDALARRGEAVFASEGCALPHAAALHEQCADAG